jgi:hypothetical protein
MADNDFRSPRSRDALVPRGTAPVRAQTDDPLAELARLIGQREPSRESGRGAPRGPAFGEPAGLDWEADDRDADDRYAEQSGPAEENFDPRIDERYEPVLPSYRPGPALDGDYDADGVSETSARDPRINGGRDYSRDDAAPQPPRYRDVPEPRQPLGRQLPAFLPPSRDERYAYDERAQHTAEDDQAYALEDYEDEAPAPRRRSGLVVVAAVLGLAVVGTAGAFAYRAMFGSSMLPSLPPIIKADDGPNKIVPSKPKAADEADANDANSGEKLVSREEKPVDMPAPVNPAPRVVSTIPIFPDPNSAQAGVPNSAQPGVQGAVPASGGMNGAAPAASPPPAVSAQSNMAPSIWPPAAAASPVTPAGAGAAAAPSAGPAGPKKIHTVVIRSDQMGDDASSAPAAARAPPAPPAAPAVRAAAPPPRAAVAQAAPRPMPAARADSNAPLSIVPDQGGGAPPPAPARTRTALAQQPSEAPPEPRGEPAAAAGGGYAVQVTSQRSEAGAQAEFRALKAKFPGQLGGHEPIIRQADLGAKGVYYRALVGPYASMDQAAAMCSRLKAAGGTCIVQRN